MIKVLDYNVLGNRESVLEDYFREPNNVAVLTDVMLLECLARSGVENVLKSHKVLSRYRSRCLVTKRSSQLCGFLPCRSRFQETLVSVEETRKFEAFCAALELQPEIARIEYLETQMEIGREIKAGFMEIADDEFRGLVEEELAKTDKEQLRRCRASRMVLDDQIERAVHDLFDLWSPLTKRYLPNGVVVLPQDALFWFPFLRQVALKALVLEWLVLGNAKSAVARVLRNENFDMLYVAHGLAFDGVLTKDTRLGRVNETAQRIYARALSYL